MLRLARRPFHLLATSRSLRRTFSSTTALLIASMIDVAPPIHRTNEGTKFLDREIFRKSIPVLAARVPAAKTSAFRAGLNQSVLDLPRVRSVEPDDKSKDMRMVLLKYQTKDELPVEIAGFLEKEGATLTDYEVELKYDYWTAEDILRAALPEDLLDELPTGFSAMGHLAHLNLNNEYLPYKYVIGQVVFDKNPRIRTVVNKLDTIHTQYRVFDMELIAGEPDFVVQHTESNCHFTFDFREVYWNSRLHTEHDRLVQLFQPEDGIVADVMAGVGPFAVPAAKKGCAVLANDLNPSCEKWLKMNVADNKVSDNVRVYCEDGWEFIRLSFKRALAQPFPPFTGKNLSKRKQQKEDRKNGKNKAKDNTRADESSSEQQSRKRIAHFVMNLPESAIQFLGAFRGVFDGTDDRWDELYETMPLVHCYCFTRFLDAHEAEVNIRQRVEEALETKLEEEVTLRYVRSVAPTKTMYCMSFRLPRKVAFR